MLARCHGDQFCVHGKRLPFHSNNFLKKEKKQKRKGKKEKEELPPSSVKGMN
jgi:hypothetical protein